MTYQTACCMDKGRVQQSCHFYFLGGMSGVLYCEMAFNFGRIFVYSFFLLWTELLPFVYYQAGY